MNTPIQWQQGSSRSTTTGLNMAWEMAGPDNAPTIVLVAGLACQLTMWNDAFCQPLLDKGYRLLRFDNRDMGLTEEHPQTLPMNVPLTILRTRLGLKTPTHYTLDVLADDALGLIQALQLNRPHLLGISMGGMIAQIMAAKRPDLIGKLVTLMSSTNNPNLPPPSKPAVDKNGAPIRIVTREGIVHRTLSLSAPSRYVLEHLESDKTINFLITKHPALEKEMEKLLGRRILVSGQEAMDARNQHTPVLIIKSLKTTDDTDK